jgi:SagB-type dehydrogenase family enzyme
MMGISEEVLRVMREGGNWTDLVEAYGVGKRRAEDERRARFEALVGRNECLWPAASVFHEHSKLTPAFWPRLTAAEADALTLSLAYKRYPGARRIELPESDVATMPLERALERRRSVRAFDAEPLECRELSRLLGLACGITARDSTVPHRAYPSGGALYPIEVYPIVLSVRDVAPAAYHYATLDGVLEEVRSLSGLESMQRAVPELVRQARPSVVIMLTMMFARSNDKYGERGYRFGLLEAGHIAQNIVLVASGLGLDTVCLGGFFDDDMNELLHLDDRIEAAIYGVLVGRAA